MSVVKDETLYALIDYGDTYVQPLLVAALKSRLSSTPINFINTFDKVPKNNCKLLQWRQYEDIDFELVTQDTQRAHLINSFVFRKALIRKHYLANTITHWLTKNPDSSIKNHVVESVDFELDYAEFLDEALLEAYELNQSLEQNAELEPADRSWWILKPGMSDRGQGIRLFSTLDELTAIFESWEPDSDDDESVHSDVVNAPIEDEEKGNMTSQLRHFVAQRYIATPLLFELPFASANRKFHVRTYVIAVGALKIWVYKPMLALFAASEYEHPGSDPSDDINNDLGSHLTNTCLQDVRREGSVHRLSDLPDHVPGLSANWKDKVVDQICEITGTLFEAAAKGMVMHFQPLPQAFEIYGLDFLVDDKACPWLLEVNAFPDFAQTGAELQGLIQGLFESAVDVAVKPFMDTDASSSSTQQSYQSDKVVKVLDLDMGRR